MWLALYAAVALAGGKKPKDPPPPPPPVEVPAEPVAAPAPPPEPPPPAPPASNADFDVAITYADGRTQAGHVVRVERGVDFYAEQGWTDDPVKLTVELEAGGAETEATWATLVTIDVKYAGKGAVDCMYESDWTPWMYTCTMGTTAAVKAMDGKAYTALSRYKWRFTFTDGSQAELYLNKLPVREQDTDADRDENYGLYAELQAKVVTVAATSVTRIVLTH